MHFSHFYKLNIRGHEDIDFVDVNLKTDIRLFLDPYIIDHTYDSFSRECTAAINSFFRCIFDCCKSGDDYLLAELLDFGHEPNETKLGLSRGQSCGKGASQEILYNTFKKISRSHFLEDGLIQDPMDICLFVENFAEDRMSDLITNIIRKKLYDFTKLQCNKHSIILSDTKEIIGCWWNPQTLSWETIVDYPLKANNRKLLLVPKIFVSPKYFYSVGLYLRHKILPQRQEYHKINETSLAKIKFKHGLIIYDKPNKKDVYAAEVKGTRHKFFAENYSRENPSALMEFRQIMNQRALLPGVRLTDDDLDRIVYRKLLAVS
jgi:hypothetical protein